MDRASLEEMGRRYPQIGPLLNITFKTEGINALRLLWGLKDSCHLRFADELIVAAMIKAGSWNGDQNRTVGVYSPRAYLWDEAIFLERISKDIESIRLASHHPLNVLMTGRKKKQEDECLIFLHECYGDLNHTDLPEFSLSLSGELEVIHGLPQITFKLKAESETIATIILDGWSGQIFVNGFPTERAYFDPKEFHQIVRKLAYDYVEEYTAA